MLQPDYMSFFDALAMALLAGVALALRRSSADRLPWAWLALSAAASAVDKGLGVWPPATAVGVVRLAAAATAFLALVEFGRRGLGRSGRLDLGPWIYVPLLLLAAPGALAGRIDALGSTCRFALGVPGGLLAGLGLWFAGLRLAAVALWVYAPAVAFSIPAIQTLCALTAMTGAWLYRCGAERREKADWARRWLFPAVSLLVVVLGWIVAAAWRADGNVALSRETVQAAQAAQGVRVADVRHDPGDRLRTGLPVVLAIFAGAAGFIALGALANRFLQRSAFH